MGDSVFGAAPPIRRDEGDDLVGVLDNALVALMHPPGNFTGASDAGQVRAMHDDAQAAPAGGGLGPLVDATATAADNDGATRQRGHRLIHAGPVLTASGADDGDTHISLSTGR